MRQMQVLLFHSLELLILTLRSHSKWGEGYRMGLKRVKQTIGEFGVSKKSDRQKLGN